MIVKVKIPPCQSNSLNLLLVENIAVLNTSKPHENNKFEPKTGTRWSFSPTFLNPGLSQVTRAEVQAGCCRSHLCQPEVQNLLDRVRDFVDLLLKQLPKSEKQASECVL